MIARYNLQQIALGVLCVLGSLFGYASAYLFFRYVPVFIARQFQYPVHAWVWNLLTGVVLLLLTWTGWRAWRKQGGFHSYFDSGLYQNFGGTVSGYAMLGPQAEQVSGLAYVLGQLFLAGPLMALRAVRHFRNPIPAEPGLEERLATVLARLRQLKQWEELRQHPSEQREILLLAQMRQIDFSARRGEPRFRAFPPA